MRGHRKPLRVGLARIERLINDSSGAVQGRLRHRAGHGARTGEKRLSGSGGAARQHRAVALPHDIPTAPIAITPEVLGETAKCHPNSSATRTGGEEVGTRDRQDAVAILAKALDFPKS